MEKIAVIGIGKMGLCFALNLARAGFDVLGVDINAPYVDEVNQRSLHSFEPQVDEMLRSSIRLKATTQLDDLRLFDPEIIFVMVATPEIGEAGYDHTLLDQALDDLTGLNLIRSRVDIVIGCTTLPGYSDKKKAALKNNYYLSYSPQFIAQGSIVQNQQYPDQVLIGEADAEAGDKIEAVYHKINFNQPSVHRMSLLSAEITKLATNCFLTMKIAFANAVGDLSVLMGGETEKILQAVGSDSRIGRKFLSYGFGYGGPCLPRDNRALAAVAKKNGIELFLSNASDNSNRQHLDFQFQHWMKTHPAQDVIHFYRITYKKESILLDESQELSLAVMLATAGRKVRIHERAPVIQLLRQQYGELFELVEIKP